MPALARCCVSSCPHSGGAAHDGVSFFPFPPDQAARVVWLYAILPPNVFRVCSEHFTDDDFSTSQLEPSQRGNKLKEGSYPSRNLPHSASVSCEPSKHIESENFAPVSKSTAINVRAGESTALVKKPTGTAASELDHDFTSGGAVLHVDVIKTEPIFTPDHTDMKEEACDDAAEPDYCIKEEGSEDVSKVEPVNEVNATALQEPQVSGGEGQPESLVCSYCDREFRQMCDLMRHVETHFLASPIGSSKNQEVGEASTECEKVGGIGEEQEERDEKTSSKNESTGFVSAMRRKLSQAISSAHQSKAEEKADSAEPSPYKKGGKMLLKKGRRNYCSKKQLCPFEACGEEFPTKKELDLHVKAEHKHQEEKSFPCDTCGKVFISRKGLKSHQNSHTSDSSMKVCCPTCGLLFSSEKQLSNHIKAQHAPEKPYQCELCEKGFVTKRAMKSHQHVHTGERPFACEVCGKSFPARRNYLTHSMIHTGKKPFKCESCGKCFTLRHHFRRHITIHTGMKPHKCGECGKTFPEKHALKLHQTVHTGVKPFMCEICGKTFATAASLKLHVRDVHVSKALGEHECGKCGQTFSLLRNLKQHKVAVHEEGGYTCGTCGKKYKTRQGLKSHTSLHTGEKPYVCKVCGSSFRLWKALQAHENKHKGVRPYKCGHCDKAYYYRHSYECHLRTHLAERPFKCEQCGKGFVNSSELKRHVAKKHG